MNLCPDAWQRPRSRGLIATSCDGGHPTFQWRKLSMAITTTPTSGSGARVRVQKFGTFLSNMVMPNIGAFIAWGFITAFFIPVGWTPNEKIATIVGPGIYYLIPLLIAYTGGYNVYKVRGG